MKRGILFVALCSSVSGRSAVAQFSSDIPGIPRASISIRGGHQNRTEWTFTGFRIPGPTGSSSGTSGDSIAGGIRLGIGTSYRIGSQFEASYDLTVFDAYALQPPKAATPSPTPTGSNTYLRGLTAYGIRIGAKMRPIVSLDQDGNGYELAFGGGIQPQLRPLYGVEYSKDSVRQGGQFLNKDKPPTTPIFTTNPFAKLSTTTELAGMASYRSRRIIADAALIAANVNNTQALDGPSPTGVYSGLSVRAGASYRVWPELAIGAAYWGNGAPPWRDEVRLSTPGTRKIDQYGALIQFGGSPEAGIDLMYTSPNGNYAQSGRLYIRARSTR